MIWSVIEFLTFGLALLVFVGLIISNLALRIENKKIRGQLGQEAIDRVIVMEEMRKLMSEIDSKNSNQNDGFLKFVSDSREAAFKYIEEVQSAIEEFDTKIGPAVKYYKETGKVLDRKPSELIRDLSEAYDKLMNSMPKEEKGSDSEA